MKQTTLYVATGNPGKLRDFALAAAQQSAEWPIAPLEKLSEIEPPDETGETFEENARLKALYYSRFAPGSLVLADDSGLEVDALGGAPGVYSARYAERAGFAALMEASQEVRNDLRNNACLLAALAGVPAPRAARYRCVLAAALDGEVLCTAEGTVEGEILPEPRGSEGFGYDPLFLLPELSRTMGEIDRKTRLGLSHRGAALRALLPRLAALSG